MQLYNGTEYVETMLACFKVRAVPINVNYRYVEDELAYLFTDADLVALVHDTEFTDRVDGGAARGHRCCATSSPSATASRPAGALGYDDALAAQPDDTRLPAAVGATTSTSSTPAARPACRRASCGGRRTSSSPGWAAPTRSGTPVSAAPEEVAERLPTRGVLH